MNWSKYVATHCSKRTDPKFFKLAEYWSFTKHNCSESQTIYLLLFSFRHVLSLSNAISKSCWNWYPKLHTDTCQICLFHRISPPRTCIRHRGSWGHWRLRWPPWNRLNLPVQISNNYNLPKFKESNLNALILLVMNQSELWYHLLRINKSLILPVINWDMQRPSFI